MKKQLANLITASRIVAAAVLFFFKDVNGAFLAVYGYCALSDLIDGPVARRFHAESNVGALMDTVGDVATYVAFAKIMLANHRVPTWALAWYIPAAAGILSAGIVALKRFGRFFVIHSLFGKAMGLFAFLMPFALYVNLLEPCFAAVCATATVSAVETVAITALSPDPERAPISLIGYWRKNKRGGAADVSGG